MKGRWSLLLLLVLLLCVVGLWGCSSRCYMSSEDFHSAEKMALTGTAFAPDCPPPFAVKTPPVRTVLDPDAKRRPISLPECIALALEHGRLGNDNIRVLALEPASAGSDIENSLARFDTHLQTGLTWNTTNQPLGTATQSLFGAEADFVSDQSATFNTTLIKPLASGGVAGITFKTVYDYTNLQAKVNPSYAPNLAFTFEQPLLQGYGVEINQLRSSHPGSTLNPFPTSSETGILLARVGYDQARIDFDHHVQDLVYSVEEAYWNLYSSYWNLYSRETALRQVLAEWQAARKRFDAAQLTIQDLAAIEEQYHALRGERLAALGNGSGRAGVLEAERQLRLVIGLPPEDGERLVPADRPTIAPYVPDYAEAIAEALVNRPDVVRARDDLKLAQMVLFRERDGLRPDLRFISSYDVNSIGSRLDGSSQENALRELANSHFHDWTIGLQLNMPLGFREANSLVRKALLQMSQRAQALKDQEERAAFAVQHSYRQLCESYEQIRVQNARRQAAARQLWARHQEFQAGLGQVEFLLSSQRSLADAMRDEQQAVSDYNIALADFEHQKGTILGHDNVKIEEGALPHVAKERASEHIRERELALSLREHALPVTPPPVVPSDPSPAPAAALPQLFEKLPPLPELPAPTPLPRAFPPAFKATPAQDVPPVTRVYEPPSQWLQLVQYSKPIPTMPEPPLADAPTASTPDAGPALPELTAPTFPGFQTMASMIGGGSALPQLFEQSGQLTKMPEPPVLSQVPEMPVTAPAPPQAPAVHLGKPVVNEDPE